MGFHPYSFLSWLRQRRTLVAGGNHSATATGDYAERCAQMARANNVQFRAAQADAALAKEDRVQARATLLPGVSYNNQFLYTEGNGLRRDALLPTTGCMST